MQQEVLDKDGLSHYTKGIKKLIGEAEPDVIPTETIEQLFETEPEYPEEEGNFGTGEDGGYYTPSVTQPSANTMNVSFAASKEDMAAVPSVTITLPNGPAGADGAKGDKGDTGPQGPKGDKGDTGATGSAGANGADGVGISSVKQTTTSTADDGNNVITVTLTNGATSTFKVQNGSKGSTGATGAAGYSPVRGTDYWTAADKAEIKAYVDEAILGGTW